MGLLNAQSCDEKIQMILMVTCYGARFNIPQSHLLVLASVLLNVGDPNFSDSTDQHSDDINSNLFYFKIM